jgi:hypothetical protein
VNSVDRDRVAMRPPAADLTTFPRKAVDRRRRWWRNHGTRGAWFFASGPGGRFDLERPAGTLYLASTPQAAALEHVAFALTPHGTVPSSVVAGRFVSELTLPVEVEAAHCTTVDGRRWGVVPMELATGAYSLTRAWAAAFAAAGFTALWTVLRFSGPWGRGLAVFGPEGPRAWPAPRRPATLRQVVETTMRLTVVDPPSSRSLTVLA